MTSKVRFSDYQMNILSKNKYVLTASEKAITYTNDFKIHFIAEYSKGKTSRVIFEEVGAHFKLFSQEKHEKTLRFGKFDGPQYISIKVHCIIE